MLPTKRELTKQAMAIASIFDGYSKVNVEWIIAKANQILNDQPNGVALPEIYKKDEEHYANQ